MKGISLTTTSAAAFTNVPELNVILPAQGIFSHMRGIIGSSKPQMVNIFPLTTLHFTGSSKTWLAIKLIPETTTKTTIQCFLYSAPAKTSAEFEVAIEKLKAAVQTKLNLLETLQKKVVESNASLSDGTFSIPRYYRSLANYSGCVQKKSRSKISSALNSQPISNLSVLKAEKSILQRASRFSARKDRRTTIVSFQHFSFVVQKPVFISDRTLIYFSS